MIDQPRVGIGEVAFASAGDLGLHRARVTQCALSRVCGVCARSLSRPLVLIGSVEERARNAFHFPPSHRECAEHAVRAWGRSWPVSLGQESAPEAWVLVSCSGFEFVRADRDAADRRPVFTPNSEVTELPLPA